MVWFAVSGLLSGGSPGAEAQEKPGTSASRPVDPLAARRALLVQLPKIEFRDIPFDEFVTWLQRETQVNVVASWKRIEKAGVPRDTPVTVAMQNALLADVLDTVLAQLSAGRTPLGYRATDNVILITTQTHLDQMLETRTYSVEHLVSLRSVLEDLPRTAPPAARVGKQGGNPTAHRGLDQADPAVREMVALITATVSPDSWKVNGGSGTIAYFRGRLIVRTTPEVHAMLSGAVIPTARRR